VSNPAEEILIPGPAVDNHAVRGQRLGIGTLALYGSGMLVQDTLGLGLGTLLLFYLTIVCGMSGSAAGLALGTALVADSFVDPFAGSLSDNSRSRHGRRHPYMLAAALPIAAGFAFLFSVPTGLSGTALFIYVFSLLMVVRVGLSFFQVPYIALGAELSDDYSERSTIVAWRVVFTVVALMAGAYLAFGVFFKGHNGQLNRDAYAPYAITCGAVAMVGALLSTFGTLSSRDRLHAPPEASGGMTRMLVEVIEVFRNRSFTILFGACLVLFIGLGFAAALGLYANTYFWKLQPAQILTITLVVPVGYFFGVFIAMALTRVLEKRWIAMIGIAMIGIGQLVPAALRVSGVVITPEAVLILLIAASAFTGVGASCSLIGFQSMMADAADEHEHLFGARREGLYFAGISFSAKASSGIGALLAGFLLDLISFPHGTTVAAQAHIPTATVVKVGLLQGPGAALITAISVMVLMLYRRGRREHEEVRQALLDRRAVAQP
jgi:GPH family glycoside/pentoside/hexuronide:cation symporter